MTVYIRRAEETKFHPAYNSELKPFMYNNKNIQPGDIFMGYIYKYTVVKVGLSKLNEPAAYCIIEKHGKINNNPLYIPIKGVCCNV